MQESIKSRGKLRLESAVPVGNVSGLDLWYQSFVYQSLLIYAINALKITLLFSILMLVAICFSLPLSFTLTHSLSFTHHQLWLECRLKKSNIESMTWSFFHYCTQLPIWSSTKKHYCLNHSCLKYDWTVWRPQCFSYFCGWGCLLMRNFLHVIFKKKNLFTLLNILHYSCQSFA